MNCNCCMFIGFVGTVLVLGVVGILGKDAEVIVERIRKALDEKDGKS